MANIFFRLILPILLCFTLIACQLGESQQFACARLAAHPEEKIEIKGELVGLEFTKIDKLKAVKTCRKALEKHNEPSVQLHLARALLSKKPTKYEVKEAKALVDLAIKRGYTFANLTAGYIAYTFEPTDGVVAANHYQVAAKHGVKAANIGMAYALLFRKNTEKYRATGLEILNKEAKTTPSYYMVIADYHLAQKSSHTTWTAAKDALNAARKAGNKQATLKLAEIYSAKGSPIINIRLAREMAQEAVKAGLTNGYGIWIDTYYRAAGNSKKYDKAFSIAKRGAAAGNAYSGYIAGYMSYYGQGTHKDTLQAEKYLKAASKRGSQNAKKLLASNVTRRANMLRNLPKHSGQSCVKSRVNQYDRNNIDYRNGCKTTINTLTCSRQAATEFFSLFDGKDRKSCRRRAVGAGKYIDNFYGANRNSSFLRKAISNTHVIVGACHPPLQPHFQGNKVICRE